MKKTGSLSGGQKLKHFMFHHWEKFVLVLALGGIVGFYLLGGTKKFDKTTPDKMLSDLEKARQYIDSESWNSIGAKRSAVSNVVSDINNESDLETTNFSFGVFRGPAVKTLGLRKDPDLKPVKDLMIRDVKGVIAINGSTSDAWTELSEMGNTASNINNDSNDDSDIPDNPADLGGLRGRGGSGGGQSGNDEGEDGKVTNLPNYIKAEMAGIDPAQVALSKGTHRPLFVSGLAVTGVVPFELQRKAFDNTLKNAVAYDEDRDQPRYVFMEVQRQEQVADGEEAKWKDVTQLVTRKIPGRYAAKAPEFFGSENLDPTLSVSLPPFCMTDYRKFFSHPSIPKLKVEEKSDDKEAKSSDEDDVWYQDESDLDKEDGNTGKQGIDGPPNQKGDAKDDADKKKAEATYKVVRFFDPTAEAGKSYRYRVRVWIADPNNPSKDILSMLAKADNGGNDAGNGEDIPAPMGTGGIGGKGTAPGDSGQGGDKDKDKKRIPLEGSHLDRDVRARLRTGNDDLPAGLSPDQKKALRFARSTPWSETEWASVAEPVSSVIAGPIDRGSPTRVNSGAFNSNEPVVKVVTKVWDRDNLQVPIPATKEVMRASVLNFRSVCKILDPIDWKIYEMKHDLGADEKSSDEGVMTRANAFVVDVIGGQEMPYSSSKREYFYPGEVLVMNEEGKLVIRDELEDRKEFRHSQFMPDEELVAVDKRRRSRSKDDEEESEMQGRPGGLRGGGTGLRGGR